ncbi:PAS domain-containing protein [Actinomyces slackii]|uniref:Aerotaxis receptor n=1 Tax=Actinomyces slackii TaxID=52774 RepID=A0A3S4ULL1_9ACTO|nr:PAS domain-containing protein [Actinomyces slackii]VEG73431.1 Aerotaxis receptor [Actinomyces slackii]
MPTVKVTGATHEVGVDQLFFSTTDARGVIRHSNNVFIELSRYGRDELSGAPHNIIRHPEMPGGAFKAMWDTLQAGSPFAAYVRNLAADGSEYDVFATVTPLSDGGYLSVRTRPVCTELFDTACAIYRDARAVEDTALALGDTRRDAALKGLERIAQMLADAGLSSYEEFQNAALPAEVARREELSAGLPQRPGATGDLRTMLDAVTAIAAGLDSWLASQDELAALSASLRAAVRGLTETLEDPRLSPERIAALDQSDPRVRPLAELLNLWTQMQGLVRPLVSRLVETLAQLDTNGARTRFRIALARLHTTITALFTVELIDGVGDSRYSAEAIPDLIETLTAGLVEMERQAQEHRSLAGQAVEYIGEASRMMTIPRQLLMLWTGSPASSDPSLPAAAAELSLAASGVVESVGERLAELDEAAARCQSVDIAAGASDLRGHLQQLTLAARSVMRYS